MSGRLTIVPGVAADRPTTTMVEVRGLHKRYGDSTAVDDLSLSVDRREIFGIVGRNGAGKTSRHVPWLRPIPRLSELSDDH